MGSLSAKDCFGPRDSSWLISAIVGHGKPWVGFDTNSLLMLSEKARECFERGRRCMVFHAFRIGLRDFGRNTDGDQQRDHQSMSRPDLGREVQARLGQEDPTIGPRGYKPFPLEAADALERRRMRDAEPLGDFSCARLAMGYMQISDEFDVVLGQSGRARRTRSASRSQRLPTSRLRLLAKFHPLRCEPRPALSGALLIATKAAIKAHSLPQVLTPCRARARPSGRAFPL
jgi:hypothetical protein